MAPSLAGRSVGPRVGGPHGRNGTHTCRRRPTPVGRRVARV